MAALLNPMYVDYDGAGRRVAHPSMLDRTDDAVLALTLNPKVIAELALTEEESTFVSRALKTKDAKKLFDLYKTAMDRHVRELLDEQNNKRIERGLHESDYEAAIALQRTYP